MPTYKLNVVVSYVGHAFQTCHVITSNNGCSNWQNDFRTVFVSWGKTDAACQIYTLKV